MKRLVFSASPLLAALLASIVGMLTVAPAASAGQVSETVSTLLPGGVGTSQTNVSVSSLNELKVVQANGDETYSHAMLDGPDGSATLNVHACSGPAVGFGIGSASASATLGYQNSYVITSDTLAIGTPVFISLVADGARQATEKLSVDLGSESINDTSGVSGSAQINFALPSGSFSFVGTFNVGETPFSTRTMVKTGLFDGLDSKDLLTVVGGTVQHGVVAAHVGDFINVGVAAEIFAGTGAVFGVEADADAQVSLNWGIHSFGSDFEIISVGGQWAPDNNELLLTDVIAGLPPRPDTIPESVPEPSTALLAVLAIPLIAVCLRRRSPSPRLSSGPPTGGLLVPSGV